MPNEARYATIDAARFASLSAFRANLRTSTSSITTEACTHPTVILFKESDITETKDDNDDGTIDILGCGPSPTTIAPTMP